MDWKIPKVHVRDKPKKNQSVHCMLKQETIRNKRSGFFSRYRLQGLLQREIEKLFINGSFRLARGPVHLHHHTEKTFGQFGAPQPLHWLFGRCVLLFVVRFCCANG